MDRPDDHNRFSGGIAAVTNSPEALHIVAAFGIAVIAFWPSYLSRPFTADRYTHVHAITATLWMLMLVAQPLAIRTKRLTLHRRLGRSSYALAPVVLMSMVLLAHSKTHGVGVAQNVEIYVPLSLTAVFALSYTLGILTRRTLALHARFMVCTALTLIDPVLVRMMFWVNPNPTWRYQWFTFAVTELVFVVFIWRERMPGSDVSYSPRCSEYSSWLRRFCCSASIEGRGGRHSLGGLAHCP